MNSAILLISIIANQHADDLRIMHFRNLSSTSSENRQHAFDYLKSDIQTPTAEAVRLLTKQKAKSKIKNRMIAEMNGTLHWKGERTSEDYYLALLLDMIDDKEASNILMRFVSFESLPGSDYVGDWMAAISGSYPVAGFLVRKGEKIVPEIINALEEIDESGRRRRNLCWVLREILGKERATQMASERVKQVTGKRRENLEACQPLLTAERIMPNPRHGMSWDYNIK